LRRVASLVGRWLLRFAALLVLLLVLWVTGSRIAAAIRENGTATPPPSQGRLVPTGDGAIFVQVHGPETGAPVILLHGSVGWSAFWGDFPERLARDGYRAIAVDIPPFGYSDRSPTGAYGRKDQARRFAGLVRSLNLQKPIIVGHSFGAGAAVETLMQSPSLFGGLVLIAGALSLPEQENAYQEDPALLRWATRQPLITENMIASIVSNPIPTRRLLASFLYVKEAATDQQVEIVRRPFDRPGTTHAYAQWLPTLLLSDRTALSADVRNYASIALPTALIWGDRDSVTPLPEGQRLNRLIPGSTLSVLENVGHIPHIEAPDRLYAVLSQNLKALSRR
jgi:pimeloyl-ACP methyl ester carboxylesterase